MGCIRQFPVPPTTTSPPSTTSTTPTTSTTSTTSTTATTSTTSTTATTATTSTTSTTATTSTTSTTSTTATTMPTTDPGLNDPESTEDRIVPIGQAAPQQAQLQLPQSIAEAAVSNFALPITANVWLSIVLLIVSFCIQLQLPVGKVAT